MLDSDTPAENPATPDSTDTTQAPAPASDTPTEAAPAATTAAKKAAKKAPAKKTAAKKTAAKRTTKKATAPADAAPDADQPTLPVEGPSEAAADASAPAAKKTAKKAAAKKTTAKKTAAKKTPAKRTTKKAAAPDAPTDSDATAADAAEPAEQTEQPADAAPTAAPLFQAPDVSQAKPARKRTTKKAAAAKTAPAAEAPADDSAAQADALADDQKADEAERTDESDQSEQSEQGEGASTRRRRRRGGRRRRKSNGDQSSDNGSDDDSDADDSAEGNKTDKADKGDKADDKGGTSDQGGDDQSGEGGTSSSSRRRRRRRRAGDEGDSTASDDPENTVTRVRKARSPEDEITALSGSTRLEAKKQRRREGREAGRRRAPIVSEAEFLARRESVDRVMVIRQREDLTQIAVLEDKVLVEHYVARESQTSLIGNVYLGKVQNVLPSMEAAFIDIGKGRNAVLYAGEVNWDALGAGNGPRKIEQVLKSGQNVLVQVTKDPVGHKGARLTSQVSLPGRFLVYVPDGTTSGISRKLPDTERNRLKTLLKEIVPDTAGVIVRTAAEGASEEELTRDVERLTARWDDISAKVAEGGEKGGSAQLLYGEPDLTLKVVRDLFTEDFGKLVVSGDDAWDMVESYVEHVAPDLADRLEKYDGDDAFSAYRIDEQIAKALDRKVWLPSGGSLIIDRTEAMTVVDVNTGKFTGSGGNLEETVTKNNLEAAEEIVRQLRLRDIGGIIVVDFIDMVLESNRDLVLRRMVECLGRDRTRHQVAEVTSLGLVQMTRKRIGTGLLEAFSESCEHCQGRGLIVHHEPVEPRKKADDDSSGGGTARRSRRSRRGKGDGDGAAQQGQDSGSQSNGSGGQGGNGSSGNGKHGPSPAEFAAMAGKQGGEKPVGEAPETPTDDAPPTPETPDQAPAPEQPEQPEQPQQPVEAEQPAPAAAEPEPQPEPEPEQPPAPPAAPTVVTSSRRRVARRPAGPPSTTAPATAVADAGPAAQDGAGTPGADAETEPGEVGHPEPAAAHVPVKKKGSRKR
ncbi:Rne/Rng family ribonuclease [Nocardioides iriomotensis]|uniref:Ribonuclease E n=1 Tax=Nocardioides iriomotensis TaxID=715784 RepID=A0A4Q5J614_9ACTN|nr:Rne/Rng family ribonuclease [Nocardioides iriomotensis]RYU13101.1 Rne/Rng family ribonuclease [Nocardioides iriomotensis]